MTNMAFEPVYMPLGLKQLMCLERVVVTSQPNGVFSGNKYVIMVPDGAAILTAEEQGLQLLKSKHRGFRFVVTDSSNAEIGQFSRNDRWHCSVMKLSLCGEPSSQVHEKPTLISTVLHVLTADDSPVLRIKGSTIDGGDTLYELQTLEKKCIGYIKKLFKGFMKECFTPYNEYELKFPQDLDVRYKFSVIGACVLIDFLNHL